MGGLVFSAALCMSAWALPAFDEETDEFVPTPQASAPAAPVVEKQTATTSPEAAAPNFSPEEQARIEKQRQLEKELNEAEKEYNLKVDIDDPYAEAARNVDDD